MPFPSEAALRAFLDAQVDAHERAFALAGVPFPEGLGARIRRCLSLQVEAVARPPEDPRAQSVAFDALLEAERELLDAWPAGTPGPWSAYAQHVAMRAGLFELTRETAQAGRFLRDARALASERLATDDRVAVLVDVAGVLGLLGRSHEALATLFEARALAEPSRAPCAVALAGQGLAALLAELGDGARARELIARLEVTVARVEAAPTRDPVEREMLQAQVAWLRARLDRVAAKCAAREGDVPLTLALGERLATASGAAGALYARTLVALALSRAGRFEASLDAWRAVISDGRASPRDAARLAMTFGLASEAALGAGQIDEALGLAEEACARLGETDAGEVRRVCHGARASALDARGRATEALDAWSRACDAVEDTLRTPLGPRLDSLFIRERRGAFDRAVALAAALGRHDECASLIERFKARSLDVVLRGGAAPEDTVSSRIDELDRTLDAAESAGERDARRSALLDARAALVEEARVLDPRARAVASLRVDALCAALDAAGCAALSLHVVGDSVIAALFAERGVTTAAQTLSPETLRGLEAYESALTAERVDLAACDLSVRAGVVASDLVPRALLERALAVGRVAVVPGGRLHAVAWGALVHEGRRIFERATVSSLPSLACVTSFGRVGEATGACVLGAPQGAVADRWERLPGAAEEVRQVARLYGSRGRLLTPARTGREATRGALLAAFDAGREGAVLHLACHGRAEDDDALGCALVLADACVDAASLARRHIAFDEVVLSACRIGRRPARWRGLALEGEDFLGLPGAFLEAGARSVLASLTPVEDGVGLAFMVAYHRARARGLSPAEALASVQRAALVSDVIEPARWLGFVTYGVP